jgi:hypothetical protein
MTGDGGMIGNLVAETAQRLERLEIPRLGGIEVVREKHLSDAVKDALAKLTGIRPVTRVIGLQDWPSLGRSTTDVVLEGAAGSPRYVFELKWCCVGNPKIYEAVWDLFKMALARRPAGVEAAMLIIGAPAPDWRGALYADLFEGGTFTPEELCSRRFPTGRKRPVWDWMLEGGYERWPLRVPATITTLHRGRASVADGTRVWDVRAVEVVAGSNEPDVPFTDGWPRGVRPHDARYPRI